jgi:membrane peptidoglycan carboxypeptidase
MTSSGAASQAGLALKQVVSLIIAQRHPSRFLGPDRAGLAELTDAYLRVLAENEVIDPALRDRALAAKLRFRANAAGGGEAEFVERPEFVEKKGTNAVRGRIAALLGLDSFYDLDRLDLTVESEIDAPAQNRVTAALLELRDPKRVAELGLKGFRLLDRGDPAGVTHSFSLYERGEGVNWLRVQTDNVDQPFSMVEGAKIDLGSTAKLRTLVTYLDIVAALHAAYAGKPAEALRAAEIAPSDVLSRWAVDQLLASPGLPLRDLLDRAMQRPYSASPTERFFTGGGVHEFHNFDSKDDNRVMSVAEAFRNSVNLVFVRLMRDVVAYYQHRLPNAPATLLADPKAPERLDYLRRFADREGRVYLGRFYAKYRGLKGQEITDKLIEGMRLTPTRLVAAMRYLYPDAGPETLDAAFDAYLPEADPDEDALEAWHEAYAPDRYDLVDRAYTMGVHPLELWLAGYLAKHPEPSWSETVAASANERIEVYRWLYRTSRKRAQDVRIKGIIEIEAFLEVHQQWQKLGYPFDRVVPSLATSIGASADRPSALADLMGILLNDGVRMPTLRVERLHFAAGTPYETVLTPAQPAAERVLPVEVARVAREALADVVANGTARRVHKAFPAAGQSKVGGPALAVGGKTGTGDHREKIYARGNQKVGERVRGRAATFVFYVGDRFYGIVTAYVAGAEAADYRFTSGLPVQILAHLAPTLREIIDKPDPARDERLIAKTPPDKSPPALQPEPAALKRPRRRSRGSWQFPGASLDFRRARSRPPGSPLTALRRKKGA